MDFRRQNLMFVHQILSPKVDHRTERVTLVSWLYNNGIEKTLVSMVYLKISQRFNHFQMFSVVGPWSIKIHLDSHENNN